MDNCWQRKCGPMSMLQSTSHSPLVSSSLPDSHSQFLDAGQNFYSCIPQDSISLGNQAIQQPGLPWASNSNVVNSSPAEFSGSFISFLSGPLPPFQGELQHSSNSNCVFTLNEKPINRKNANGSASGNGPVLVPAVELSQHFSSRHFKAGETLKPIAVIDSAKREMARPAVPSHYVGNEKIKHSSFPRGTIGLISDSSVTFNDIPDRMKSKQVFPETGSSGQLWPSISGHPRVFCLGISGYLLLRNPGFLGVICLCHGSHMSLSRFCEHSGLSNVNPGNAVHMESGVTIAQWRRVFFQKLGIRAPEDHGGWDWPEVLPVGTGLGEFYPSHNCSLNSELFGAFGATGGAGQSWNNLSISKSPPTSQEEVDISVQNVKQTSEDSRKLTFCGSISTSKSRLFHESDMELTSCSNPHRLASSNLDGMQGPENGSSFISACIGSNSKDANTFNSVPDFKISKSLGINSSLMQMDRSSISSNIELRLGHSSQQSKKLGTLAQPDYECHTIVKPTENQQSLFPEPFMHKVVESQAMEEGKSSFHMFNLSPSSGKGQLDLVNSAYGVHKVSSESRNRNSAFPMLQAHFNGASEGILYPEATKNRVNGSYIPPEEPHCESLTLKCDQINFNCARGNITNREFNIDTSCDLGHGNNDKGVSNNFYSSTELNFGLYCKYNETKFKRVVEGIGPSNCLALNEKNFYPCKPYGMITDMHDSQNTLNLYGNASLISHNGPFDKSNVKSVCKPMDAIAAPPTQAVPLGFPLSSSTLIRNQTLQSSNRASLNERQFEVTKNPRMQTLHHGLRLSIPAPGSSSTAATKEHVLRRNPFDKVPTSINRLYESDVANTRNASKIAELSAFFGVSDYMAKRTQTIAPIIDQLEGCDVDPSHGGSLRPHDSQLHCQLSTDFNAVYWPHVRHGCSESNFSQSVKQAKCFQEAPNSFMSSHCSCAVQPDTSVEKHHFVGEPLHITPREQKGISGCIKKNISACKLDDSHKFALKKVAFSEENSDLMGHKINRMEFHSSQWRDVPKKVTGPVSLTCKEQTSSFLNMNDKMSGQNADSDANKPYCDVAFQNIECLKESEMSTVSSGGSTPVVSDGSSVIHDKDISTADGQNNVASNVIVDEGSGIDRSWSSNDAQGSEQSAEFFCVASGFNPVDAGPSKKFVDNSSRSLIDEIRLRDSLRLKKMQKQSSFGIQEMSHCVQKEVDICKKVLRKRTKWRKLDTTFPASAFYCACSYPGGNCGAWLQCSCKDKEGICQSGIGSAEECSRSFEPSSRERRFRMRLLRTLSCNSKVNCEGAKTIFTQSDILKSGDDDTFGTCELPRRKRPKLDTVSSVKLIDEGDNLGDEAAGKCSLVECTVSSEMHDKIYRRVVRPIVWGKYGVISNGSPSRPVKFGSLKTICDSLAKCSSTGKCTTKSTSVKCRKASANEKHRRINKSSKLKKAGICNARVITAKKSKSHILTSNELDLCRSLEQSRRANCHGGEQGTGLLYPLEKRRYDCVVKTGDIADGFLPSLQKPKSKEIHKQSLYEFTLEGIYPGEGTLTCARTEGYKGRKKEGVRYNFPHHSELGGGCLVAQEQLNAWIHITGQKSSRKEILRLPPKDAEYDYRKEYAHYKHSKGWKSLVVYKSGIHALGLYTSRFISQGEMVVEYVGEIVGLRVSDKRENEYLSGKKLQYKSACYFFRIDQEHIVDATQKGGIARFVNHSCQPNCVAKIISVRNDKKVVFFAERDIYPGEEITYDYNFNHEDEGKKIPCYCNSKNCRQYLN